MNNLEALLAPITAKTRPCVIGKVLLSLPEEPYRRAFQAMLDNPEANTAFIEERLREAGLVGRWAAIDRHRKGTCCCEKGGN